MKVCVIGAGVVGCATAYELMRQGHEVTLVDAADGPGTGTSFANGAQLSYSYVEPLANPATLRQLPKLLWDKDSPVRFELQASPSQWAWGLRFLWACRRSQAEAGARRLLEIAALSRRTLETWMAEEPLDFGFRRNGKLVLCPDQQTLDRFAAQVQLQANAGVDQYVLGREACIAQEPALAGYERFVGGIWTPSECVGDPYLFCQALTDVMRRRGVDCRFGTAVQGFEVARGKAICVRTAQGAIRADWFVLATGIGSRALARSVGERLPIYPVKGYSLTLDMNEGVSAPEVSVTDTREKMVLAPVNGRLRVAAMAEMVGWDLGIPQERVERMVRAVERVYPGLCRFEEVRAWAGLRPVTPDSVPIVRVAKGAGNVVVNVGQGALGFTLAAGCAGWVGSMAR